MVSWWMAVLIAVVSGGVGGFISAVIVATHHEELSSDLLTRVEAFINRISTPEAQKILQVTSSAAKDIDQALTDIRVLGWSSTILGAILTGIGIVIGLAGPSMATWITSAEWPSSPPSWLPTELLRAILVVLSVLAVVLLGAVLAAGPVDALIRRVHRPGPANARPIQQAE